MRLSSSAGKWFSVTQSSEFAVLLHEILERQELLACSFSKVRNRNEIPYQRVSIRPLALKGRLHYQVTYHFEQKELHENLLPEQVECLIFELMNSKFRQGHFFTPHADWQTLVSKKGVLKLIRHAPSRKPQEVTLEHNRPKQYLLQEGTPYPFLVELGVMNQAGKVLAKRYHKFRQLNKYLEIVEDCLPYFDEQDKAQSLTVVDFGSGKAYLTFALYHYLVEHLKLDVEIIGLDLKEDVVSFCNEMVTKLGYGNLTFYHQDIKDFQAKGKVDMVVSLHACDVATDYALAQAVKWQAKVILAVPCCHRELFHQLEQSDQSVLLEHGILKERVAALLTDAARAKLLEAQGYAVRIMEFVDLEHTPKNLMIRAFRDSRGRSTKAEEDYGSFKEYWSISPTLEALLSKEDRNAQSYQ